MRDKLKDIIRQSSPKVKEGIVMDLFISFIENGLGKKVEDFTEKNLTTVKELYID